MRRFVQALSLLTILPVRLKQPPAPGDSGRAAAWYPVVGLLIGCIVAGTIWLTRHFVPPLLASALTLTVWVSLSGGLHLDGLADCCDGLLNASSPQRRLEIMRDPHLGSFGVIGMGLILILKMAALVSLPYGLPGLMGILLAASSGRWLVLLAGKQPLARPDGMGADFKLGLQPAALLWGALVPLTVAVLSGLEGWAALLAAHLVAAGTIFLARRRIGGVTGDVFGALIELGELAVLLIFSALW